MQISSLTSPVSASQLAIEDGLVNVLGSLLSFDENARREAAALVSSGTLQSVWERVSVCFHCLVRWCTGRFMDLLGSQYGFGFRFLPRASLAPGTVPRVKAEFQGSARIRVLGIQGEQSSF